jgi:hypothetical protein
MSFSKIKHKSKRLIGATAFFRVFEQSVKLTIHHQIDTLFLRLLLAQWRDIKHFHQNYMKFLFLIVLIK